MYLCSPSPRSAKEFLPRKPRRSRGLREEIPLPTKGLDCKDIPMSLLNKKNYVKSLFQCPNIKKKLAKPQCLGRKFHSQNSLRTKIRQFDEIFGQQRKFLSKILFSKLDGNVKFPKITRFSYIFQGKNVLLLLTPPIYYYI